MRIILSTALFCLIALFANSQVSQVHLGHCKKKEMEIITGETVPDGYVILQMGVFMREDVQGTLEGLTKKQLRTMKMYCHWRHACHVFIAFDHFQTFENFSPGADFYENKVCYYILAPTIELKTKE